MRHTKETIRKMLATRARNKATKTAAKVKSLNAAQAGYWEELEKRLNAATGLNLAYAGDRAVALLLCRVALLEERVALLEERVALLERPPERS